jgi:hypothetical protein
MPRDRSPLRYDFPISIAYTGGLAGDPWPYFELGATETPGERRLPDADDGRLVAAGVHRRITVRRR